MRLQSLVGITTGSLLSGCTPSSTPGMARVDATGVQHQSPESSLPGHVSEQGTGEVAQELAAVVCTTLPERMSPEAEIFTDESWTCLHNGEQVRIDLYGDDDQMTKAEQFVLDLYRSSGDNRSLAELPLVCGSKWTVGFDLNEARDVLTLLLEGAGIEVSDC